MAIDRDLLARATAWQPQQPGVRRPRDVQNALVEPHWEGLRVIAAAEPPEAEFVHGGGVLAVPVELRHAMAEACTASGALVEGHLTTRALETGEGVVVPAGPVERPSMLFPKGLFRRQGDPWLRARERERQEAAEAQAVLDALGTGTRHAFVATDLLWLDGMALDDIPLLERKRLLASVVAEGALVRVGPFVTHTAVATHVTWGSMGFRELHYRAANSRYRAGEENPDWAVAPPPKSIGAARGA